MTDVSQILSQIESGDPTAVEQFLPSREAVADVGQSDEPVPAMVAEMPASVFLVTYTFGEVEIAKREGSNRLSPKEAADQPRTAQRSSTTF